MQQVEGGNPVDLAALKAKPVTDFDEAGDERRFEIGIRNVFARRILTFGDWLDDRSVGGKGLQLPPHSGDGTDVSAR